MLKERAHAHLVPVCGATFSLKKMAKFLRHDLASWICWPVCALLSGCAAEFPRPSLEPIPRFQNVQAEKMRVVLETQVERNGGRSGLDGVRVRRFMDRTNRTGDRYYAETFRDAIKRSGCCNIVESEIEPYDYKLKLVFYPDQENIFIEFPLFMVNVMTLGVVPMFHEYKESSKLFVYKVCGQGNEQGLSKEYGSAYESTLAWWIGFFMEDRTFVASDEEREDAWGRTTRMNVSKMINDWNKEPAKPCS